jgi:hypothetical protein
MMSALPSLIPNDRIELLKQEYTAPAMLEAMIERRPYSDTTTRKVVSIGPRADLKKGKPDESQTP